MKFSYDPDTLRDIFDDARPAVDRLLQHLEPFPEDNETPEGRARFELIWLRQEIAEGTLEIPQEKSGGMATIRSVGIVDERLNSIHPEMKALLHVCYYTLYKGRPRLRPKFLWLVGKWIDYLVFLFTTKPIAAGSNEHVFLNELTRVKRGVLSGEISLPVQPADLPIIALFTGILAGANGERIVLGTDLGCGISGKYSELEIALFYGFCPVEAPDPELPSS